MDHEFRHDIYGQPIAKFSMGHEALGHWFTEELRGNLLQINALLKIIQQLEQREPGQHYASGREYCLTINQDEVEVVSMALEQDAADDIPAELEMYADESFAQCGLQDFKQVLLSWRDFVG